VNQKDDGNATEDDPEAQNGDDAMYKLSDLSNKSKQEKSVLSQQSS
jgi:hypothetical protein